MSLRLKFCCEKIKILTEDIDTKNSSNYELHFETVNFPKENRHVIRRTFFNDIKNELLGEVFLEGYFGWAFFKY